jgi:hypothetical protein
MAVESTLYNSALTIKYKEGVDSTGKDIIKAKKYSNVKVSAIAQEIYDTAQALGPLMKYPINEILRSDDSTLVNA